jgi:hypothetical protein
MWCWPTGPNDIIRNRTCGVQETIGHGHQRSNLETTFRMIEAKLVSACNVKRTRLG